MAKRSADTEDGSIGERAGSALDAVVQPVQSVVNSVREAVSSAVSGVAGFMKEPSDTMLRQGSRSRPASGRRVQATRAGQGVARKTRAAVKTTARKAAKVAKRAPRKTTSRKPAAAPALARRQH